jgi:hypothetical protein
VTLERIINDVEDSYWKMHVSLQVTEQGITLLINGK